MTHPPDLTARAMVFTAAWLYVVARAANAIPEFRQRIRGAQVIEHDVVHPAFTVLVDDDVFVFCTVRYTVDFTEFAAGAAQAITAAREQRMLEDTRGRDELLLMTAIPWVSFTGFKHPMQLHPADSSPRFAWGKYFEDGERLKLPLDVQGHHALMDGLHVGRFYQHMQELLDYPESLLSAA